MNKELGSHPTIEQIEAAKQHARNIIEYHVQIGAFSYLSQITTEAQWIAHQEAVDRIYKYAYLSQGIPWPPPQNHPSSDTIYDQQHTATDELFNNLFPMPLHRETPE